MATIKKNTKPDELIINNIEIRTIQRQSLDIEKWRTAIKQADSVYYPIRLRLYDIYSDILFDSRLKSCIAKRKVAITNSELCYTINGKEVESIETVINSQRFKQFLNTILDTTFWGHTLIQFDYSKGTFAFDLIPRRHINPKFGTFLKYPTDTLGTDYRKEATLPLLEIFPADSMNEYGLLCDAAQYVIYKRNGVADWAQFAEIFGQPIREGIYDATDVTGREQLKKDMTEMGSSTVIIHPKNTEINIKESSQKQGSSELYDKLKDFCNKEIAILILGNDLTTESGSKGARSLGEVQKESEKDFIDDDRRFLLNILNTEPFRTYFQLFYPEANGGEFLFVDVEKTTATDKANIFQIASQHVPIPDEAWYELMNIPVPDNLEDLKAKKLEADALKVKQAQPQQAEDTSQATNGGKGFNFFD